MNRIVPIGQGTKRPTSDQKGIHDVRPLHDAEFDGIWESLLLPAGLKDRLLAQAVLPPVSAATVPFWDTLI
jgi:hypothetical protein